MQRLLSQPPVKKVVPKMSRQPTKPGGHWLRLAVTGVALILGVDRILDMLRTTANVTGDATVSVLVNASEAKAEAKVAGDTTSGL